MVSDVYRADVVPGAEPVVGAGARLVCSLGDVLGYVRRHGVVARPVCVDAKGTDIDLYPQRRTPSPTAALHGVLTMTRCADACTASASLSVVPQFGGSSVGPAGPSRRTTACTWTAARFWYSATRAKDSRAWSANRD